MDSTMPVPTAMPRGAFPPLGQGFPPQMVPQGALRQGFPAPPMMNLIQHEKVNEFSKGIYVSGFERTLTTAMLQQHFKIKPIAGLKLPLNKHTENKGFAFIYYQSPDDAAFVKEKLDYSVILRNKIRVTKTVVAESLSKMMFKLKTKDLSPQEIQQVKARYFNQKSLQSEVAKIINPIFNNSVNSVQVNKIIIPHSKLDKKNTLPYARGFFYISNINEASKIVRTQSLPTDDSNKKNYELVLKFIVDKLNANPDFSRHVKAQIYQYANKNRSNVIHIKNISVQPNQDPAKIAEELKKQIQEQRKQSQIVGCYVAVYQGKSAWANVVFKTFEQAHDAYEHFKNNRIKFRENVIYANLRNYKDPRTVVVSTVKKDVNENQIRAFLNKLAERSPRVDPNDQTKGRKYDFASFNIIEQKTFYHVDSLKPSVGLKEEQKPQQHWRETNTVPRRIVLHFLNDIQDKDVKQLVIDIKLTEQWDTIFIQKDNKHPITANHQKGHIEGDKYVRHSEPNKRKQDAQPKERIPRGPPQNKRMDGQNQFNMNKAPTRNFPRNVGGQTGQNRGMGPAPIRGQGGFAPAPQRPMNQVGSIPTMGGGFLPKMVPTPVMGGMQVPMMGSKPPATSMPMMGIPMTGMPPPMGLSMGGMMPPNMPLQNPKMGSLNPNISQSTMPGSQMGSKIGMGMPAQMNMPPPGDKKQ